MKFSPPIRGLDHSGNLEISHAASAYWDDLNLTDLATEVVRKSKNPCDADAGYMNRTNKPKGFHYLNHQCSDADTGIILDVSVTGGDVQDCECCVDRYSYLKNEMHYPIKSAGLDSGYDTIPIHYGLTRLGIDAYIRPCMRGTGRGNTISKDKFIWQPERNCYICPNGCELDYRGTWKSHGVPLRSYVSKRSDCKACQYGPQCYVKRLMTRKITRKPGQECQEQGRSRIGSYAYREILRKRQIVCEGNFALQKRCHNLRFTRKRGIENVLEQCLLSASALNLKRLVKGISRMQNPLAETMVSLVCKRISCYYDWSRACDCLKCAFVNRPMLPTLPSAQRMVPLLGNRAKRFVDFLYHYLSSLSVGTFCEIVKGSHVVFLFDRSWWRCGSAPMPSSLPYGNEAKEMILYPLILPFFPTAFLAQFSAPYFSFLAACTSAVWSWPALPKLYQIGRSFSFQIWGSPMTFRKNKRRITM